MTFSDRIKTFKRTFARNSLFVSTGILTRLPYPAVQFVARIMISIGFFFTIRQKKIARESLQIAFGTEKSPQEIEGVVKNCFWNLGEGMIELIYFMAHPRMIKERVSFEGQEHLNNAFDQGNGMIAISAHFGNFPLMLLRCAQEGYKTNAIIRPTRDQKIEEYFQQLRTSLGLNTVYSLPRKQCVDTSLRVLRNNEFLFIPLDQNFGSGGGVFVDFFGQKAATATGPKSSNGISVNTLKSGDGCTGAGKAVQRANWLNNPRMQKRVWYDKSGGKEKLFKDFYFLLCDGAAYFGGCPDFKMVAVPSCRF